MKILLLYFSGTGNTEYIARYIKDHFNKTEYEVSIVPIEELNKAEVSDYDILGFGFPVYACDLPDFIRDYLRNLPLVRTKSVFIYCTKAFYTGAAIKNTFDIFRDLGYISIGYADVGMPGSDGLAFMKPDSKRAKEYTNRDFSKIIEIDSMIEKVQSILDSNNIEDKAIELSLKPSKVIVTKVLKTGLNIGEGWLKKRFRADESCIKCKKCERICPRNNIKVDDTGVHFSDKCVVCMRCLHQCPKESIQIGKSTVGKFRWKGPLGDYNPLS